MTKIHKISKDLYEMINEDTGHTITCDTNICALKQAQINKSVGEQSKTMDKHVVRTFWEIDRDLQYNINIDEFKQYLKSVKSQKEVKIPTGRMIFSEDKYNTRYKSIMDRKAQLVKQFNNIANDFTMSVESREKALTPIRREFNELNNIILSKDAKEFEIAEHIAVKIKPIKALETYLKLKEHYDAENARLEQEAIDKAKKHDANKLKDFDEDDFALVKRLHKLIESKAFYEMFKYKNYDTIREAISFESKEEYLNRPRNPQYESYKITFTQEEAQSVLYLNNLKNEFKSMQTEKRLQEEAKKLQDTMICK
jgi:hypothetical protein